MCRTVLGKIEEAERGKLDFKWPIVRSGRFRVYSQLPIGGCEKIDSQIREGTSDTRARIKRDMPSHASFRQDPLLCIIRDALSRPTPDVDPALVTNRW